MIRDKLQHWLDEIRRDPLAAMDAPPPKRNLGPRPAPRPFSTPSVLDGSYITQRDQVRALLCSPPEKRLARATIPPEDRPEHLADRMLYTKAAQIDGAGLGSAKLNESPWSDDYWGLYLGVLGKRYADPAFPSSTDFAENLAYIEQHPVSAIVASGDQEAIDRLSPSEKYDLLIGDPDAALTTAMWNEGRRHQTETGKVETWMGICHGWAAAAYMLGRPRRTVTTLAADGKTRLRFFPSDIKGLASLLWANGRVYSRFIGQRCNDKSPTRDENGRFLSQNAFDTNPGAFHLVLANQIGVSKRSFVMDATYDYEVWNQPVYAYECTYFNPMTMASAPTLREATVARADFQNDRFSRYRGECTAIVGVAMEIHYVVETKPSHAPEDMPARDAIQSATYAYDLELDAEGTIVGGEWYQNRHPDFLWTPPKGAHVTTVWDSLAYDIWNTHAIMPLSWRMAAAAAAKNALPHPKIVDALITLTYL